MADNYLDKKFEEYNSRTSVNKNHKQITLNTLLSKNRSCRGYDASFVVRDDQLRNIIEVNTRIPSAKNQQVLRFRPVTSSEADNVLPYVRMGSSLPELRLPVPGTEPNAFIIICSTVPEDKSVYIDLGISVQSMLLRAVELGLSGLCIGAFDKEKIKTVFDLQYEPLLILAIGRSCEKIKLISIDENDSHDYYRIAGIHYVPKLKLDDLIIR